MTTRHTPGPWRLLNQCGVLAIHKGAKPVIAWPGFDSADVGGHAVNLANATLIAAAPELADALEACMSAMRQWGVDEDGLPEKAFAAHDAGTAALRAAGRLPSELRAAPSAAVETREEEET